MNIFGIGLPEMILIMLVALLIFGPKKLPEIGRSMGKAIKGFQDASREFESEFKREADRIEQTAAVNASVNSSVGTPVTVATTNPSDTPAAVAATVVPTDDPINLEAKEVISAKDA